MSTNEYELSITAFQSEEEYNNYINVSNKIDAFCTQAKILETVAKSNKYVEVTLDFCDNKGDIQNSVKIFSPILEDTQEEREIFAEVGSKIVRLGTETAFESGGARLGTALGTAVVELGLGTPPAWIMGAVTGGAFYLGGKYIGVAVGHYTEQASYDEFLKVYDKYFQKYEIKNENPLEVINTETNTRTLFEQNKETNQLEPTFEQDLTTNTVVLLQPNQTISHVAQNTPYTSDELLEYNNLSQEEAKRLPVGFEVQIPKGVTVVDGEYGAIKIYEGYDNTGVIVTPNEKITYDEIPLLSEVGNNNGFYDGRKVG
jgi:hypothetical protein